LPLQRSCFEPLAVDLSGPTGISPSQSSSIRSQDGPSCRHRISASFGNPLGFRTFSMRSVRRNFQGPIAHLAGVAQTAPQPSATWSGPVGVFLSWRRVASACPHRCIDHGIPGSPRMPGRRHHSSRDIPSPWGWTGSCISNRPHSSPARHCTLTVAGRWTLTCRAIS
jgi:hypothetical protein